MASVGLPNGVDDDGDSDAEGVTDDEADEEGLPASVGGDAADFHDQDLEHLGDEDGADGIDRPPREAVAGVSQSGQLALTRLSFSAYWSRNGTSMFGTRSAGTWRPQNGTTASITSGIVAAAATETEADDADLAAAS
ncbi:MAG: hypothetical protein CME19_05530 [Gemmatimonadetes bacterium]|nr:hypothetical protein [Gemmatimonadota bacterium]